MKCVLMILFFIAGTAINAQTYIEPRHLEVTTNKTTNLVFPAGIVSIDRGSEHIVVQKSTGNILRVKADIVFADTTNLTVITDDGKLYSFLVHYNASPVFLNLNLGSTVSVKPDSMLTGYASAALEMKVNIIGAKYEKGRVRVALTGIYTNGELLICRLRIENHSNLSFDLGTIHLSIKNANRARRGASQETEVSPLFISGSWAVVPQKTGQTLIVILPKLTLADGKQLLLQLPEKGGGRNLLLTLRNQYILKAIPIR